MHKTLSLVVAIVVSTGAAAFAASPLQATVPGGRELGYGPTAVVTAGATLPASGSEGEPEPVNSLPNGFATGTAAFVYRQSVAQYWAKPMTAVASR